jgi:NADPH-dependent glutamate synthase beta subunit-like oxidoreductase/NAD(P)H-flavin reductase
MPELHLGFGFQYQDLFDPSRLSDLTAAFDAYLAAHDPAGATKLSAYRHARGALPPVDASQAITGAAAHLGAFVAELFGVQAERTRAMEATGRTASLFAFKKDVVKKRILKRPPEAGTLSDLRLGWETLLADLGVAPGSRSDEQAVVDALWPAYQALDRTSRSLLKGGAPPLPADLELATRAATRLAAAGRLPAPVTGETRSAAAERHLAAWLEPAERYLSAWHAHHEALHGHGGHPHPWVSLRLPRKLEFEHLVALKRPNPAFPEMAIGPEAHLRHRDGFVLTDRRMTAKEILSEVDYCLLCQERDKDSCSKGFREKGSSGAHPAFKPNPLGVPLAGCPLEEKIGEAHTLRGQGDSIGALAIVTIDNPMCPGTGHRICNDCMKACIFQKQEPVNIPQVETGILTDVLDLPWGFEIYGLLTRWNPLHPTRQHPRAYIGRNALIVGLGPAGYTLAQHLLREGFGIVAIDGLKIEPLPERLIGAPGRPFEPIRNWRDFYTELDERSGLGFGGVSEYGITIRWDKNFLTLIAATLQRWSTLRVYGGIRFGGTLDLDDAWRLGIDHVAICAGAGKPTLVDIPNGMIRGIRQASDFLMALQLTGAYRKSSLANLQVRLPAVVIGGGLTAIDTATELSAYYIVQCEKALERFEAVIAERGRDDVLSQFDPEEREALAEQIGHGREVREERARAQAEGRAPHLDDLINKWGGVTIAYRRTLQESPAYRLNHEEIIKSLEEGIRYAERLSPREAVPDKFGAVQAIRFDRMTEEDGRLKPTGEMLELPARTVCVAAGTAPNTTYEREFPGAFAVDPKTKAFLPHRIDRRPDGVLAPVPDPDGWFTSYAKDGHFVSFYGDNLPRYAGSVVKAMASAKDGYPFVSALFEREAEQLDSARRPDRVAAWEAFATRLDQELKATVLEVRRLTPTITEIVVQAPLAARKFRPGQFYRLQNYEADAPRLSGVVLATEGLALTGAWTDPDKGLLSMIVLELGVSSRLSAMMRPGQQVIVMGPTGTPTEIPRNESVLLAGGGLGNAVLFSIGRALRQNGCKVIYFAGYRSVQDVFRIHDIEASADQVIWSTDRAPNIQPRRPQDRSFVGNIVQAMVAYASGELGEQHVDLAHVSRIIAIGSDRMMNAVRQARHGVLKPFLKPDHVAIGSINSPMQCMMKEICAQCLQRHVDPVTGQQIGYVFSCFNQDQTLDTVDFNNLAGRLRQASMQEKLAALYLDQLWSHETARAG